jgi:hypothetical protein
LIFLQSPVVVAVELDTQAAAVQVAYSNFKIRPSLDN